MTKFAALARSPRWPALIAVGLLTLSSSAMLAADDPEAPTKGAAVTVLKAAKSCFANIVEVSGTIIPREETQVRPERMGLKVAEVMVDAGDSVTAGQVLARLTEMFDTDARAIRAESRLFKFRYRSPAHFLDVFKTYYGPMLKAFAALDPAKQEELHNDLNALIVRMNRSGDGTMVVPSEYLEVVITKR